MRKSQILGRCLITVRCVDMKDVLSRYGKERTITPVSRNVLAYPLVSAKTPWLSI